MNKLRFALSVMTFLILTSCSDDDKPGPENNTSILNSPAFKGITDSINREPDNVELILTRAIRLSQNNYHKLATPDYKKAYEMTGDEGVALEYASNLLLANDFREALNILETGSKKFPENTEFSRRLAEIHVQRGDNEVALKEYDKVLAADSSNFEALYDKGALLARMKDTSGAIAALEKSFRIVPINLTGIALANIYTATKNPRAVEICDVLIERDTAQVQTEAVFMKGVFYYETNQDTKAIEQFDECIRRDWKMTDAYIEKGIIYFERKDTDEALKVFGLAATVSNTDADVYFWMGRCHEQKGNRTEAVTNYRRALALDDTFVEAKEGLRRLSS